MQLRLFADWIPLPQAKRLAEKWIPILRMTIEEKKFDV